MNVESLKKKVVTVEAEFTFYLLNRGYEINFHFTFQIKNACFFYKIIRLYNLHTSRSL